MHLHILGICGTFMGGIAALAAALGHRVTGSDRNVYPPMSTQLRALGIEIHEGFDIEQLEPSPDVVVIGNAMSRGNPAVEAVLDQGLPYISGPQWLAENVLAKRHVIAVSGTHGKTTTASMLSWILEHAGIDCGFLIGGVSANFESSARLGGSQYFVVEADEYDTAFFDKRAKFVHYRPRTLIMGNLEFDHADIYRDLDAIIWQFHQLLRTVPRSGRLIVNGADANLQTLIRGGCWTPIETFGLDVEADWTAAFLDSAEKHLVINGPDGESHECNWKLGGRHNLENALAAVAASCRVGVSLPQALEGLTTFDGVKRRMERTATVGGVAIYDDFAHHPTAIRRSLEGLRKRFPGQRLIVALEPRSNTMKLGIHNKSLADSLQEAHVVFVYRPPELGPDFEVVLRPLAEKVHFFTEYADLVSALAMTVHAGDLLVFMSNGAFGGARQQLTSALRQSQAPARS
ncbi:MAG: UDP-N-acetylmuramate:L-alanyl-gamma-D-glutamyl-meso-diaminopimelate ligase [Woeseia sp.]